MNKKQNKESLLQLLSSCLIDYGFTLNKGLAEFTRKQKYGWDKFQLIFIERKDGWEINAAMLIRINLVENIYHQSSNYELKYQKTTPTIGITFEKLINDGNKHRCSLSSESHVEICKLYIESIFKGTALPFFDKCSNIPTLEEMINLIDGTSIFCGLKYEGKLGIILAKLVNNPNYSSFEEKYRNHYINLNDGYYLKEYEDTIIYLRTLSNS